MKNPFKGTGVALVTPFDKDYNIDYSALKKLVRFQIDNGTDFLVVQGTTGESPCLSNEEKMKVLNTVIDENNGALKIVYGVGGNNTKLVGELFKQIPDGVDGILSVSPYYNKPTQDGIIAHFTYLSSCTDLPIILYNVPGRTASNMTAATSLKLAEIDNIVAVKEASGDMDQIMEIIRLKNDDFGVLSGDDALTMSIILCGGEGVISVVANSFPKLFSKMVSSSMSHEVDQAKEIHYDLLHITRLFFQEGNPGGVKAALNTMNIMEPTMRLPLVPISEELYLSIKNETLRLNN
ncbi:MAG: 4-hydroxy-tetrahydrodipicolinate synthase [Crocinitomicaceae bacterium]|nr:4-hydroxy-tetrahydrodipicolinate synthase [Crocinitomicaceae bacterium]|tara:strand:+ start:639 stop:1517 length:879 start_codon:yes stop_codon:yes gene_type:complete